MSEAEHIGRTKLIEHLLRLKFGGLVSWVVPDVVKTVGPFDPGKFDKFALARDELLSAAKRRLNLCSISDLSSLYLGHQENYPINLTDWDGYLRKEIRSLEDHQPLWFASGFGHPAYVADFEYWGQMEYHSLAEALCLSIGVEPMHFNTEKLAKIEKHHLPNQSYPTIEYLVRRYEQFRRKFPLSRFHDQIRPCDLFNWFDEVNLDVHPGFTGRSLTPTSSGNPVSNETSPSRPDKREIDSVAQLFTAVVIDSYGYDPKAARSPIPNEIRDIAAKLGIDISDDTIRKYLKIGAKFISADWEPT